MPRLFPRALAALLSTACGALCLLATPAAAQEASGEHSIPVVRVMPLGDSITAGVGSSTKAGYRMPLWNLISGQSRYSAQFVGSQRDGDFAQPWHEGHSGWLIGDIDAHVDQWLAANPPDVILLHIGINDLNRNVDVAHAPDRLAALLDRIYTDAPDVTVVLQGLIPTTPGLQGAVHAFNQRARQLEPVESRRHRQFDYIDAPALAPTEFADSLHPNDLGYARMAEAYFQELNGELDGPQAAKAQITDARPAAPQEPKSQLPVNACP
ncbi:SGNH/GDSL hydrolase family protein [Kitasatospora sp. RB6PN24]|uniref:SGNH/GDSL hydrolase family protein n=1 Tax=Kitasatospora humi TaxID=2893891 RepID=UPI001E36051E|nr:SGNH/GDSL hydrolase family protein [Kitasatospora humi]MCC9310547.1 SGNH/GDSL hydrolase family protein [Kitasatospora humi]